MYKTVILSNLKPLSYSIPKQFSTTVVYFSFVNNYTFQIWRITLYVYTCSRICMYSNGIKGIQVQNVCLFVSVPPLLKQAITHFNELV